MGKYMRKCRGIGEVAVKEVSQVVGVRTRARTMALAAVAKAAEGRTAKRRKVVSSTAEYQIAYLELRSRSLVMTPRISRSPLKNSSGVRNSRSSSNGSCEMADLRSNNREVYDDSETAVYCFNCSRERRETTPSCNRRYESDDLESTADRKSSHRSTVAIMPLDAEIEEFFVAAERKEKQRFADMYNYDVVNDVPLEGPYEWVRITP